MIWSYLYAALSRAKSGDKEGALSYTTPTEQEILFALDGSGGKDTKASWIDAYYE